MRIYYVRGHILYWLATIPLAHQNLAQLSTSARATIAASTSIKMLGGVNEADARAYAGDLRTTPDLIMAAEKRSGGADFVTFIKNHMRQALTLNVGFGTLERMDEMGDSSYGDLRDNIRQQYCRSNDGETRAAGLTSKTTSPPSGRGEFDLGSHEEL